MSENTTVVTATAGEPNEQVKTEAKVFTAITTQEDLDKVIQTRIARERAKVPTDYEELQAKAKKLAEIEEANKTEAEKAAERLADAEKRADELALQVTRAEVAAAKGVPAALLAGSTKEQLEAAADALIEFRGEQKPAAVPGVVPTIGQSPTVGNVSLNDQIAAAETAGDKALVASLKAQQLGTR